MSFELRNYKASGIIPLNSGEDCDNLLFLKRKSNMVSKIKFSYTKASPIVKINQDEID